MGLIVKTFVILKPGIRLSQALIRELQNHMKKITVPFKYPLVIEFADFFPKTISGKVTPKEQPDKEMKKSLNGNNAGKGE